MKLLFEGATAYAERVHSAANYSRMLASFASEVIAARPLLRLMDRLSDELASAGVPAGMEIVDRLSETCHRLFCLDSGTPRRESL